MSLEFREQSEDRQFEPGREHFIFLSLTAHPHGNIEAPAALPLVPRSCGAMSFETTATRARKENDEVHRETLSRRLEFVPSPGPALVAVEVGV